MEPTTKYDLTVKSVIVRGETATKPLEGVLAPNPNQMHRLHGYLLDGTRVVIAQRHGKGGMDFNKLLGGKVFAVVADGFSPVYEKGEDKKKSSVQKQENGVPLFSSSGFYLLSSKEYPAEKLITGLTHLRAEGSQLLLVGGKQLAVRQRLRLTSEDMLSRVYEDWAALLGDGHNLVADLNGVANKRRQRVIKMAQVAAELAEDDGGAPYDGVDYRELGVSPKDGNPFIYFVWRIGTEAPQEGYLLREHPKKLDNGFDAVVPALPEEVLATFVSAGPGQLMMKALRAGQPVSLAYVQGHVLRTSVSFRRKFANFTERPSPYGDGAYLAAASNGWTRGIVAIMQTMHPSFPKADYDAHHFVATARQQAVGMNRKPAGGWTPPESLSYSLMSELMRPVGQGATAPVAA